MTSVDAIAKQVVASPHLFALFLDIDGTVIDIAESPEAVDVPPHLAGLLARLETKLGGALAILSGRPIADLDRLLAPLRVAAAGVHGAELRESGAAAIRQAAPALPHDILFEASKIAAAFPGAFTEPKTAGVAVHYRLAPEAEPAIHQALTALLYATDAQYQLCPGRMVFEILPSAVSKGSALAALLATPPFKGRTPLMIGDDTGDLPAIAAAEKRGGFGLTVAGDRFSSGQASFESPAEVRAWLAKIARQSA